MHPAPLSEHFPHDVDGGEGGGGDEVLRTRGRGAGEGGGDEVLRTRGAGAGGGDEVLRTRGAGDGDDGQLHDLL